ncbi:hypothetical protein SELMODRAFT_411824 [Selaginella moellendorffii]|uniref:Uncharacterized protein n=1 Tax=Selaginella moellendorffii TaxID=88036 RepID=D8RJ53_SELML|nr:hypothetical protein SELMODRAFT_411824 [Selaginella moellendorffii]
MQPSWSSIMAFMPGLIPDSASIASIVLATGHSPQLVELLQAFVDGLELFEVKVTCFSKPAITDELSPRIVLGTLDRMQEVLCGDSTTWKPHRAVLVETNVLASTKKVHLEVICSILWSPDVTLGIHSLNGVGEIVTTFSKGKTSRIPRPSFTLSSVKPFYERQWQARQARGSVEVVSDKEQHNDSLLQLVERSLDFKADLLVARDHRLNASMKHSITKTCSCHLTHTKHPLNLPSKGN